ncbi:hypothetical protein [Morganella sp. EGD-HP17]|uniref:hypothetical protein n=1 Tax=Morganella sp. EGD-HP17 TaxID=1435146 RepID=UPI0012E2A77E|nr:hypothetical protein [Morganella sp. EGD-HP17]
MRICCYHRTKGLIAYFLCFNLCFLSFPRVASANPALLALVAFEVPAVAELFGVIGSYLFVGAATTVVTATTVGIAVELSRSSPVTGEAIRSGEKEAAVGLLLAESVITLADLEVEKFRKGQMKMTADMMSSQIVSSAVARYGVPSRYNPVPVYEYMESANSHVYPEPQASVTGTGLTSAVIAPYQISAGYINYTDNPDYHAYIYGGTDTALFQHLLSYPSFLENKYKKHLEIYNDLFFSVGSFGARHCVEARSESGYNSVHNFTPVSLDPPTAPAATMTISRSSSVIPVMTGNKVIQVPAYSSALYVIPPVKYNCMYLDEEYNFKGELLTSEIRTYSPSVSAQTVRVDVAPQAAFIDYNSVMAQPDSRQRTFGLLPPVYQVPELMDIYGGRALSPEALADLYNRAWQRASSRADYKGVPYTASRAATAQMVRDIRDVRNLDLTIAGALVTPVSIDGTAKWDIPVYSVFTNTYVSMLTIQKSAELDIGDYPVIPRPVLDAELDLSPILNSFGWLFAINVKTRKADCPVFNVDIEYLDFHDAYSSHCEVLNDNENIFRTFAVIVWVMIGLLITFRRK